MPPLLLALPVLFILIDTPQEESRIEGAAFVNRVPELDSAFF